MPEGNPTLSACLIVRDASAGLARCLRSIQGIADEIIIVDTGSIDNTVEISRQFTDKIYFFEWIDDFAAARNFSISKATCDWILQIDADEFLNPVSKEYLNQILATPDCIVYTCWMHYTKDYTPENGCSFLFRNHQQIRYERRIHENIQSSVEQKLNSGNWKIQPCNLFFNHSGWDNNSNPKYTRDLKLLKSEVKENPGNGDFWNRIALIYHHTGKHDLAQSTSRKACDMFLKRKLHSKGEANTFALAIQLLSNDKSFCEKIITTALERYPDNPTFIYARAGTDAVNKKLDLAIENFKRLIKMGKSGNFDQSVPHQLTIFDELALKGLADCYFIMKEFNFASTFYKKAMELSGKKEYQVKNSLCEKLATKQNALNQ